MENLTVEQQYQVYNHFTKGYFRSGELELGKAIVCPFPDYEESNPSFGMFLHVSRRGEEVILWKMHNSGDSGNVYSFTKRMLGNKVGLTSPTITKILNGSAFIEPIPVKDIQTKIKQRANSIDPVIKVRQHFTPSELGYWQQEAGLDIQDLIELDIYPLVALEYKVGRPTFKSNKNQPKFLYPFINLDYTNVSAWQMYNPLADDAAFKWRSGGEHNVIGNWQNLPESADELFITTSKKDGGVLWKHVLNKKYPFIHPPKEMQIGTIINMLPNLTKRFKRIRFIPDIEYRGVNSKGRECPGLVNAKKLKEEGGIDYIDIDYPKGCKDITELYKSNLLNLIIIE